MKYEKIYYPDGKFYMRITDFSNPVISQRVNSYEDLWLINQLKDICDHNNVKVSLMLPTLLDAQADRRFSKNESSNLKLVCKFINEMNFESVTVHHPHNPEVVEALLNNCTIINNYNLINKFLDDYGNYDDELILMSTDAGGFKPLMKLAEELNYQGEIYSASKARTWVDGKTKLVQQVDREDFGGKDILIIDDLCVYGGTFIGLADLLKDKNVGDLYLAVSHITVPSPNILLNDKFEEIYATNSVYDSYNNLTNLVLINVVEQ